MQKSTFRCVLPKKSTFGAVLAKKLTFQRFIFDTRRKTFELGEIIGVLVKTNKNSI